MTDNQDLKDKLYTREIIKQLYQKTNNLSTITEQANNILSKKELFVSKETVKKFIAQITEDAIEGERETDAIVNGMLKSIGQDLAENQKEIEEKKLSFFDKNSPENHLKYCEILVDKEAEGVSHHG